MIFPLSPATEDMTMREILPLKLFKLSISSSLNFWIINAGPTKLESNNELYDWYLESYSVSRRPIVITIADCSKKKLYLMKEFINTLI